MLIFNEITKSQRHEGIQTQLLPMKAIRFKINLSNCTKIRKSRQNITFMDEIFYALKNCQTILRALQNVHDIGTFKNDAIFL